jgi:hypothetical protein
MRTYTDSPFPFDFPVGARPSIRSHHVDGPLLVFRDGQVHWLTWWERLMLRFGATDADAIERRRRPNLMWAVRAQEALDTAARWPG